MKYLILLLVFACGKYDSNPNNPSLGQLIEYKPQEISGSDLSVQESICKAITSKTSRLDTMENQRLTFTISETNCNGESTEPESITVIVSTAGGTITFERENGNYFVFRDAETIKSGLFSAYCAADKMPFLHNGNPVWMNTNTSEACTRAANVLCVNFKKGVKDPNTDNIYRVSSEDSFALDMQPTSQRYGFYTQRAQRSNLGCETGSRVIRASLN